MFEVKNIFYCCITQTTLVILGQSFKNTCMKIPSQLEYSLKFQEVMCVTSIRVIHTERVNFMFF